MERIHIGELQNYVEKEICIEAWVHTVRDQGKLIFFDFRDQSGKVQGIAFDKPKTLKVAATMKPEWVVRVSGIVHKRPEKMVNKDIKNGDIEIEVTDIAVLNESKTPPFSVVEDSSHIDEEARLRYRYLDLRTDRMQHNIRLRSEFIRRCRDFLFKNNFVEIETPLLTESTPEGSRDFVVPSRHNPGNFYALPQSPQQYKQLLMAAGFERYVQIARALRDEDLRSDRGFEHTQIDIEMSFVNRENVMEIVETMMIETVESLGFTIKEKPFPRITYQEATKKYGDDKFDLRTEEEKKRNVLSYAWIIDFPFFEKTDQGTWTFTHNPFSMPKDDHVEWLMQGEHVDKILTTQYDLVCNGFEAGGGSIRSHKPEILKAVYKIMGNTDEEIEEKIGHMLTALSYGVPPHGGIALGVERNIMSLAQESHLREVQAFPMTRRGKTAVMDAPKPLSTEQLTELGIAIVKKNGKDTPK